MSSRNNTLDTLREALFAALKEARDTTKDLDVDRITATCEIAKQITATARTEIDYMRIIGAKQGSGFVQLPEQPAAAAKVAPIKQESPNQTVQTVPGGRIVTHRIA